VIMYRCLYLLKQKCFLYRVMDITVEPLNLKLPDTSQMCKAYF
jgi:hypothetical protein